MGPAVENVSPAGWIVRGYGGVGGGRGGADDRAGMNEWGVTPSTGSVGDCFDNAMAGSFFATLECELIDRTKWATHAEARSAVFAFIEGWYNTRRRHSASGYLSPLDFERLRETAPAPRAGSCPARWRRLASSPALLPETRGGHDGARAQGSPSPSRGEHPLGSRNRGNPKSLPGACPVRIAPVGRARVSGAVQGAAVSSRAFTRPSRVSTSALIPATSVSMRVSRAGAFTGPVMSNGLPGTPVMDPWMITSPAR